MFAPFMLSSCSNKLGNNNNKPNVILILTDDQGYGDLSCHGNPILKTPALDKLHDESVRFTDFHVSSICTPTRGQILTGRDACRNGAFAWAYSRETIHTDVPVMPEIFKTNGYATGHFGKWHLGDNYPFRPIDRGFDESIKFGGASVAQTPDYWANDNVDDWYEHNGVMKQYKGYCTDVWFEEAKKFMAKSNRKGKPFFVYLPLNAPHEPLIVPAQYSAPYLAKLDKGYTPEPEFLNSMDNNKHISEFYGMIASIDENVAKLDSFLKENGLFENTIVIYMTDNGGTGGVRVFNSGMRGKKGSLYDGGHRVPYFIRWPKENFTPRDVGALAHAQDIFPTLIDFCKLTAKKEGFDGVSLAEIIRGKVDTIPDRILVMQNSKDPTATKYNATVMFNKWRLVGNAELYNIEKDPGQKDNVARQHPEIFEKLKQHYEEWWKQIQDPLNKIPYFPVGDKNCSSITLTCFDWYGFEGAGNLTIQNTVREGKSLNGFWNIEIVEDGEYEILCSRWPKEAQTPLVSDVPEHKTLTVTYPRGIALPIAYCEVQIDNQKQLIDIKKSDLFSATSQQLKRGKYKLRATFLDLDKKPICGSYYVYINRIK